MVSSPTMMEEGHDQVKSSLPHIPQYKVIKRKDASKLLTPLYLRKVNDSSSQTPRGSINTPNNVPTNWEIDRTPVCENNAGSNQTQESNAGLIIQNAESFADFFSLKASCSQNRESNTSSYSQNQESNASSCSQNREINPSGCSQNLESNTTQVVPNAAVPISPMNKLSSHNFVNYDGNINGNKVIIVKNLQSAGINNIDSTSRGMYKGVTSSNKVCTIVGPFDTQATEAAVRSITQPNVTQTAEPIMKTNLYPNAYPIILPPMKHNVPLNLSPKKTISATSTPYTVLSRKIVAPVPPTITNTDAAKSKNPGIAVVRNQVVNYNIHYSPSLNAVDSAAKNPIDLTPSAKPTVAKKGLNDIVVAKRKILVLPKNMVTVDPRKKIILSPEPNHRVLSSPDGRFVFSPILEPAGIEQASEIRSKMESTEAANILVQLSNMDPSLAVKRTSGASLNPPLLLPVTNGSFAYIQANSSENLPSATTAEFQDKAAGILSPSRHNSLPNFPTDDDVCVVPQQATEVEIYDDDDQKSVFSLDDYGLTETVSSADALKSLIGYKNYNILLSALCGIKDLSTKSRALAAFFSTNKEYRTSHCQTIENDFSFNGSSQSGVQVVQILPPEGHKKNLSKASFKTQTSPQKQVKDSQSQCSPKKGVENTQNQCSPQKRVRNNQGQRSPQKQVKDNQNQRSPQKQITDTQSRDNSPQKNANITLNRNVTVKPVANRMQNTNIPPANQMDRTKNSNVSLLKQQNLADGAIPKILQFAPNFNNSTTCTKISSEKDRQLLEKVSGLKEVTVSANRKPAVVNKPPQIVNKSPRVQNRSSRAPNKPAQGSNKSQQPVSKPPPVVDKTQPIGNKIQLVVNNSQQVVSRSQPIKNISQPVVSKSQPVVNKSQPVVSKSQPVVSKSQPVVSKSQPVVSKSQPVLSKSQPVVSKSQPVITISQPILTISQPIVNSSQPVASETPQAETKPSQVAKKPPRVANKSPRIETKKAPVVSETPPETEPIPPPIVTRVETPEKSMTPRLEEVIQHDKHGLMKIHSAVLSGTLADIRRCAEDLNALGLSIDQKTTPDGYTALHMALIRRKNADVLFMLLSLGSDPSANNHRDQPSLLLASKPRALKQGVRDAPPPPFLGLLAATQPHVVEQVCRQTDSQGLTAIMHCARHGWADELELLLEHTPRSVVAMAHHETGQTPLDMATACCTDLPRGTCLEAATRCVELLKNALGIAIEEEVKEYPAQKVRPCNLSIKYAPAAENKVTTAKEESEEAITKERDSHDKAVEVGVEKVSKNKEKKSRDDSKKRKEDTNKENGSEKLSKIEIKEITSIGQIDTSVISSPQFSPVVPLYKPQGRKSSFKNSSQKRKLNLEGGSTVPKVATPINMKKSLKSSSVLSNAAKHDVLRDVKSSDIVTEVEAKDIKVKADVKGKDVSKSPVKLNASLKRRKITQQKKQKALESHGTVKRMILDVGIEVPIDTVISDPDHQVLREVSPVKTKNRINILDKISVDLDKSTSKKTPCSKPRSRSAGSKKGVEKANKSVVLNQSGDVIGDCHAEPHGPVTGDLENSNPLIVGDVLSPTHTKNVDSIDAAYGNENAIKPKQSKKKQLKGGLKKVIQKNTPAKTISVAKMVGNRVVKKKIASSVVSATKVGLKKKILPSLKESDVITISEAKSPVKKISDIPTLKPLYNNSIIHVNLNNMLFSSTYAEIRNDKYIQPKVIISKIISRSVRDIFANTPSDGAPVVEVDDELINNDSVTAEDINVFVDLTDDNSMTEYPVSSNEVTLEPPQEAVLADNEASNLLLSEELPGKTDVMTPGGEDCGQIPKTGSNRKRKFGMLSPLNNNSFKMKFKLNLSKNELKKIHTKNSRQSKKFKDSQSTDISEKPKKKIAKKTSVKRASKTGKNEAKEGKSKSNDGKSESINITDESKLSKFVAISKKTVKNPSVVASATKKLKLNINSNVSISPRPTTPTNTQLLQGAHMVSPLTALRKSVLSKNRRHSLGSIEHDLELINKAVKDQTQPDRPPPVLSYLSLYHN